MWCDFGFSNNIWAEKMFGSAIASNSATKNFKIFICLPVNKEYQYQKHDYTLGHSWADFTMLSFNAICKGYGYYFRHQCLHLLIIDIKAFLWYLVCLRSGQFSKSESKKDGAATWQNFELGWRSLCLLEHETEYCLSTQEMYKNTRLYIDRLDQMN